MACKGKNPDAQSAILHKVELVKRRPYLIGIDGFSGAGKSTFAHELREQLSDTIVVHKDDFYRVMDEEIRATLDPEQGYYRYFDWERLEAQVLLPLSAGSIARYQRYDWGKKALSETSEVNPMAIVIVEGVYSTRPELRKYYDLCLWVQTSEFERSRRQMERDENTSEWVRRWTAAEIFYVKNFRPSLSQFMIVPGE